MASSVIHLAISKKYCEKNNIDNRDDIYAGTLYPDTFKEKKATSHYTIKSNKKNIVDHLNCKVNLYQFLQNYDITNSFNLGWFIHLVTDHLFFEECLGLDYLSKTTYDQLRHDLYYSYDRINRATTQKYNITNDYYERYPGEFYHGDYDYEPCIIQLETLYDFIERVSSINMQDYANKILEAKCNIKPY